jgi:hypothetical protein
MTDRTLKGILVVIALELGWLAFVGAPAPVVAQDGALPVPLPVVVQGPVTIVADRPLLVENVPYTPSARPGD